MNCKYYRQYYRALGERYGKFRGKGQITISEDAMELEGKRVYSLISRILIAVAILIITEIITAALGGEFLQHSAAASVLTVFCVEDIFLRKQGIRVQWNHIDRYVIDEKKKIVSFTFFGKSFLNPIALGGEVFDVLAKTLRTNIPENEYVIEKLFSLTGKPLRKIDRSD